MSVIADIGDLKSYKEELQQLLAKKSDPKEKNDLINQVKVVSQQIASAENSIRVGWMVQSGGNFDIATMTDKEIIAMGFAFDAIGAAELRAIGKIGNSLTALIENSALTKRQERKNTELPGGDAAGGKGSVPNLTENGTLQNLRPGDVAFSQRPIRTLVKDESGRYWLQSPSGNRITPSGSYDFVTMPDGIIRVSRPNSNPEFSTHLGLSGGLDVNYAGSIRFGNNTGPDRGTIINWTNNSGHYQPPSSLSSKAGLPVDAFKSH